MFLWNLLFELDKSEKYGKWNLRLNPCFCGTYFLSCYEWDLRNSIHHVLILVFVELTFWAHLCTCNWLFICCLNPCFCGTYFLRDKPISDLVKLESVLILVFVELTFWVSVYAWLRNFQKRVLILVFVELTFWDDAIQFYTGQMSGS